MGQGIDLARAAGAGLHADVLDDFKDQLIIVLMKRLKRKYGDDLVFAVAEIDDTGQDLLAFKIEDGSFVFMLEKKS